MFTATLREIDGDYALSVPEGVVKELNLHPGSSINVSIEGEEVTLKPGRRSKHTLEELLAQCDFSLPISDEDKEWDAMRPVGRELI